jgi:hypothetical protein
MLSVKSLSEFRMVLLSYVAVALNLSLQVTIFNNPTFLHAVAVVLIIIVSYDRLRKLIMTMQCAMAYKVVPLEDFSKEFGSTIGQLSKIIVPSSTELVFDRIIKCIYRRTGSACF